MIDFISGRCKTEERETNQCLDLKRNCSKTDIDPQEKK